jgi:hypothetical protein
LYYCNVGPKHEITIHRGDKSGPVIATGEACPDPEGSTDLKLPDEKNVLRLEHTHRKLFHIHGKTEFSYQGRSYHWKGHTALVDDKTDMLLAVFHSEWFNANWNKIGRLEITVEGQRMLDLAVITALMVQERSDEGKRAV